MSSGEAWSGLHFILSCKNLTYTLDFKVEVELGGFGGKVRG